MTDEDDCGAIAGMKIGRGNRSTRRKPAPAPLCPPQIPHDQTKAQTLGRRGGKPETNRLSYGMAHPSVIDTQKYSSFSLNLCHVGPKTDNTLSDVTPRIPNCWSDSGQNIMQDQWQTSDTLFMVGHIQINIWCRVRDRLQSVYIKDWTPVLPSAQDNVTQVWTALSDHRFTLHKYYSTRIVSTGSLCSRKASFMRLAQSCFFLNSFLHSAVLMDIKWLLTVIFTLSYMQDVTIYSNGLNERTHNTWQGKIH
jgi:hypothetical protein